MSEIEPAAAVSVPATTDDQTDLERFEVGVRGMLEQVGLPTEKLFVPVAERAVMVQNVPGVLSELDSEVLGRSFYVSKMLAAATVGLFDAALNYLWDELVSELRKRVVGFDLNYFFDIAADNNADLRKGLKGEDDLTKVDDAHLLRAALKIGLVTDTGFKRLDHIRYMRNNASAAHPNENELSGLELVSFLQICIREVINTPPDTVTAHTGRLLSNIKLSLLDQAAVDEASAFFDQLPADRADTLANGLFGLYTASDRSPTVADNVRLLWPKLWSFVSEPTRSSYGIRQARATASADTAMATASRELIELVDGTAYLTPAVRAVDMAEALQVLTNAHHGMNNFYNEPVPARRVLNLAGEKGDVPDSVRQLYVRTVIDCYLGNGYGVSSAALPYYEQMVARFSPQDAGEVLLLCMDPVYSSLLATSMGRLQWIPLLEALEPKLTSTSDRNLLEAIRAFTGTPDQLRLDTKIKKLAETAAIL